MKDMFVAAMGAGHSVTEFFLPRDCPVFCTGCKACFFQDISVCPHREYTVPLWESILAADLLVLTSPTYVLHLTGQMKAFLDHFGSKWMAHSPEKAMFRKQAVVITNAIGQGMNKTAKDIQDSLDFWGVAHTYLIKQALLQAEWKNVDDKLKAELRRRCARVAEKIKPKEQVRPRLKIKGLFFIMRFAQKMIDKSERKAGREQTKDYLHWKEQGWIDEKRPWKD